LVDTVNIIQAVKAMNIGYEIELHGSVYYLDKVFMRRYTQVKTGKVLTEMVEYGFGMGEILSNDWSPVGPISHSPVLQEILDS